MSATPHIDNLFTIGRGEKLLQAGRLEEAHDLARRILARTPEDPQGLYLIARVALRMQRSEEAVDHFSLLLASFPETPAYLSGLGEALVRTSRPENAIPVLLKALQHVPTDTWAKFNLGIAHLLQAEYRIAADLLEEVLATGPRYANDVHANLASSYLGLGKLEKALEHARAAIRLKCTDEAYMEQQSGYLTYAIGGDTDAASKHFMRALELDPTGGEAFYHFTTIKKFKEPESRLMRRVEKQLAGDMPSHERAHFHFGLGKIYDDLKEWELAFQHYRRANLIAKRTFDFSGPKRFSNGFERLFTRRFLERHRGMGTDTQQPIFVLGMPRSGSTLVEQILTSHPEVATAGELPVFPRICERFCLQGSKQERLPDCFADMDRTMIEGIAADYLAALRQYGEGAARIVDKLPGNLFFIGMIRLALPQAHIIHTVRNPLDTGLSCFFQPFRDVKWSYDLAWIGRYYRLAETLMAHWRRVLPPDVILDVEYERLVDDTPSEARRIIAHCGLPWDERCLDFHRAKTVVNTSSLWQVRQPVYTSSKQRWVNYAPYIDDLVKALGPYAAPYYSDLKEHGGKAPRTYPNLLSRLAPWRKA